MKRELRLDDMLNIEYVSAPAVAPKGDKALYVVSRSDARGEFDSDIYEIDISLDAAERRAGAPLIPNGAYPAYSPDGKYISFVRGGQIWLYARATGRTWQFSTLRHGVTDYAWSADGRRIAFSAPLWEGEEARAFDELTGASLNEWQEELRRAPIAIEDLMYKRDEWKGVADGRASCVGVLDADGGAGKLLTPRSLRAVKPAFSPDGRAIACFGYPHSHVRGLDAEAFILDISGAQAGEWQNIEQIKTAQMLISEEPLAFDKDGALLFAAYNKRGGAYLPELFKKPRGGAARPLLPEARPCHGLGAATVGANFYGRRNPSYIATDEGIFFRSAWAGDVNIYRLSDAGIEAVTADNMDAHDFAYVPGGDFIIVRGDCAHLPDIYRVNGDTGAQKRLTRHNAWLGDIELARPIELRVPTGDGEALHGYVMPPVGRAGDEKYPAVLEIHGGPDCMWGRDCWFEFQLLAARGFAVAYCDPRGSAGYGARFQGYNCWGQAPIDDLRAFMDAAERLGFIDSRKWGATGGSYGGYMTNKLLMQTSWFAAAATQRSLSNLATSYGTGDEGFIYSEAGGATQRENFAERLTKSPIGDVDAISVPLLILHATRDYRCGFEQAEQLFIAMKDRHPELPVRLVAFPGENHELTRAGNACLQAAHLGEIARWFELYLKGGENA